MQRGRLALTGALIVGVACDIDKSQFTVDVCEVPTRLHLVGKVIPAVAVDYMDVREPFTDEFDNDASFTLDSVGSPCAGASDVAACLVAFDALPNHTEFNFPDSPDTCCFSRLIAFTRGDEVGTVGTVAELDAFLGPIDAPGDAALVMLLKHPKHRVRCEADGEVGKHDEGFVVFTRTGLGCGLGDHVKDHVVLVREDGSIEILQSDLIEVGEPGCSIP